MASLQKKIIQFARAHRDEDGKTYDEAGLEEWNKSHKEKRVIRSWGLIPYLCHADEAQKIARFKNIVDVDQCEFCEKHYADYEGDYIQRVCEGVEFVFNAACGICEDCAKKQAAMRPEIPPYTVEEHTVGRIGEYKLKSDGVIIERADKVLNEAVVCNF